MDNSTSIYLGDYFEKFISTEIASGRYNTADDVIKSALKLLEAEEFKKQNLIEALQIGEKSGLILDFNPAENLKKLKQQLNETF